MGEVLGSWRHRKVSDTVKPQSLCQSVHANPCLEGFIRSLSDGRFVCMTARTDRPGFAEGGQRSAPQHEKALVYDAMLAYTGHFEFGGDTVTYIVDLSLYPVRKGSRQRRRFIYQPYGTLEITSRLDQTRTAVLPWSRPPERGNTL